MAPIRTRSDRFYFKSSFTVDRDAPTRIELLLPSAPWRVRTVQPTITRVFNVRKGTSVRNGKGDGQEEPPFGPDSEPDEAGGPSQTNTSAKQGPAPSSAASGSAQTQGSKAAPFIDFSSPQSRKGKGRQTTPRDPSAAPESPMDEATPPSSHSADHNGLEDVASDTKTPEIWTRFGVENGKPRFIKDGWTSSTTDRDCVTLWWECTSRAPLKEPPDLSDKSDLAIGDVFYNRIVGVDMPRLWLRTLVGDTPTWKPIAEGEVREDGRRLYLTPANKRPSWVKSKWCIKQLVKHRGQSVPT